MKAIEVGWMIQEFAGRSIPGDISLLGFENPGVSEFQRPALTTIASPLREMAEKAVEVVLRAPKGKRESHELKVSLIERDSVARDAK
jgi:DNA-binding LacI/PurR family transcriptional regulator